MIILICDDGYLREDREKIDYIFRLTHVMPQVWPTSCHVRSSSNKNGKRKRIKYEIKGVGESNMEKLAEIEIMCQKDGILSFILPSASFASAENPMTKMIRGKNDARKWNEILVKRQEEYSTSLCTCLASCITVCSKWKGLKNSSLLTTMSCCERGLELFLLGLVASTTREMESSS